MARAGFCSECQTNVWLTEEGGCSAGHAAECISGVYEAEPEAQPAVSPADTVSDARPRRPLWPWIVGVLIVLMGCGVAGALLLRPAADKGVEIADEWKTRLEADYPGWEPVGFNFRTFQGPSGTETAYQFTLVPPGENLSVPVLYLAVDDGPAESQDEVFRPAARHHERADALLEYIDDTYYQNGKSVTAVTSDIMGKVTVEWLEVKRFGPFSSRYGSYDELRYDDAREAWIKIQR